MVTMLNQYSPSRGALNVKWLWVGATLSAKTQLSLPYLTYKCTSRSVCRSTSPICKGSLNCAFCEKRFSSFGWACPWAWTAGARHVRISSAAATGRPIRNPRRFPPRPLAPLGRLGSLAIRPLSPEIMIRLPRFQDYARLSPRAAARPRSVNAKIQRSAGRSVGRRILARLARQVFHLNPQHIGPWRHVRRHCEAIVNEVVVPRTAAMIRLGLEIPPPDQVATVIVNLERTRQARLERVSLLFAGEVAQLDVHLHQFTRLVADAGRVGPIVGDSLIDAVALDFSAQAHFVDAEGRALRQRSFQRPQLLEHR